MLVMMCEYMFYAMPSYILCAFRATIFLHTNLSVYIYRYMYIESSQEVVQIIFLKNLL